MIQLSLTQRTGRALDLEQFKKFVENHGRDSS